MASFKCKMCGGDLLVHEGATVAECEYCGSRQTVPNVDSEKKLTLFNRAGRLLRACEFDKAAGIYESLVAEFPNEAEAYWCLVLCKYGIEYVDDPSSGKKVPTCHRSGFDSVLRDTDFEQACENADAVARKLYREEAKQIEELRRAIIQVSGREDPYDVFICYKETGANGERTLDSVLAQDVYDALTEKDYRVFFSRITLEDKLGVEYEPYIFAALNSAKIMLVFGTDYDYFNAVWVKNEWSRFMKLMEKDKTKHLIPCYKNIDAYDIPEEFAKFQALDMGKLGAIQDLLRGIRKLIPNPEKTVSQPRSSHSQSGPTVSSLMKRAKIFLSESEWSSANEYFNKALDIEPENSEGYIGLMLADLKFTSKEEFEKAYLEGGVEETKSLSRAKRFEARTNGTWLADLERRKDAAADIRAREKEAEEAKKAEEAARKAAELEEQSRRIESIRKKNAPFRRLIGAGRYYSIGLLPNGTTVLVGNKSYNKADVYKWHNITAIAAGGSHPVGLKSDGTVVVAGDNYKRQGEVSGWSGIKAIAAGLSHTVGVKYDGTVVAAGDNLSGQCDTRDWSNIAEAAAGDKHTVGLKYDGTVVAVGDNSFGACNVSGWSGIVAVAAGERHTVGLKGDGTVVATGMNTYGQCLVSEWKDIVSVAAAGNHTVGVKKDGTVICVGSNENGSCNVSQWTDIVAVAAGPYHTIGLKSDGFPVAVGENKNGQCNVAFWEIIKRESESKNEQFGERQAQFSEQENRKPITRVDSSRPVARTIESAARTTPPQVTRAPASPVARTQQTPVTRAPQTPVTRAPQAPVNRAPQPVNRMAAPSAPQTNPDIQKRRALLIDNLNSARMRMQQAENELRMSNAYITPYRRYELQNTIVNCKKQIAFIADKLNNL